MNSRTISAIVSCSIRHSVEMLIPRIPVSGLSKQSSFSAFSINVHHPMAAQKRQQGRSLPTRGRRDGRKGDSDQPKEDGGSEAIRKGSGERSWKHTMGGSQISRKVKVDHLTARLLRYSFK